MKLRLRWRSTVCGGLHPKPQIEEGAAGNRDKVMLERRYRQVRLANIAGRNRLCAQDCADSIRHSCRTRLISICELVNVASIEPMWREG